jgi:hypothetical protein
MGRKIKNVKIYEAMLKIHLQIPTKTLRQMKNAYLEGLSLDGKGALLNHIKSLFPKEYKLISLTKRQILGKNHTGHVTAAMIFLSIYGKPRKCKTCKITGFFGLGDRPDPNQYVFCSSECSCKNMVKIAKKKIFEQYGVKNIFASKWFKNNRIKFLQEKYGEKVTGPTKVPGALNKIRKTSEKRYGVSHFAKAEVIKDKRKQTNLKRYGYTSYLMTPACRKKIATSCMEKWGVDHPSKAKEIKIIKSKKMNNRTPEEKLASLKKSQETCRAKVGANHYMQVPEIFEKRQKARTKTTRWRKHLIHYQGCENKVLKLLENHPQVKGISTSRKVVGTVRYKYKGKNHVYYPDIAILKTDGSVIIVEAKANRWLGVGFDENMVNKNISKIKEAYKHYATENKTFILALHHREKVHIIKEPHKRLVQKVSKILKQ